MTFCHLGLPLPHGPASGGAILLPATSVLHSLGPAHSASCSCFSSDLFTRLQLSSESPLEGTVTLQKAPHPHPVTSSCHFSQHCRFAVWLPWAEESLDLNSSGSQAPNTRGDQHTGTEPVRESQREANGGTRAGAKSVGPRASLLSAFCHLETSLPPPFLPRAGDGTRAPGMPGLTSPLVLPHPEPTYSSS